MNRRLFLALVAAAGVSPILATAASNNVRILVGAPPGGGTDLVARTLAQVMSHYLHNNIVVENRPGAAGNIAASAIAEARGDKDAMLLCYTSHAINPNLPQKLPFDPVTDFTPISLIASGPLLLVAGRNLPVNNIPELAEYAKKQGVTLSIAGTGIGSASQLSADMLRHKLDSDAIMVPYKGAAPALQDVMGGQVDLAFVNVASAKAALASDRVKALGISTSEKSELFPDLEPVANVYPGFNYRSWYGLLAPKGLDTEAVKVLEKAAMDSVSDPKVRDRLEHEGLLAIGSSSDQFAEFIVQQIAIWGEVVRATRQQSA